MKSIKYKYSIITSLLIAFLINFNGFSQELDASNYKMRLSLSSSKQDDNSRILEVSFIGQNKEDRKDKLPVFDAQIKFYNQDNLLGEAKTSNEGIAQFTIPDGQNYITDADGYINFSAKFEGSDAIDEDDDDIQIKDLFLELNLTEVDTVKTVLVRGFTKDSMGVETPLEGVTVSVSIGGMFSKMKMEEVIIEDGEFEFEFPTDIPGDVNGDLTVYATVQNSDDYGTVVKSESVNWGVFEKNMASEDNQLWSAAAPIWMYVVLSILLLGVWANYLYTVIFLFRIKKEGKEIEAEETVLSTD